MTRIDHSGHDHPATTKARTECRNALNSAVSRLLAEYARVSYLTWTLDQDCFRVNGKSHATYGHDAVTGQPTCTVHHTSDRECAIAMIEAGMTWSKICWMRS